MTTIEQTALLTGDAYFEMEGTGHSELVEGVIVPMSRTGAEHGYGVFQVWIVDPEIETIWRYRSPGEVELLERGSVLYGEGTLSGFSLSLDEFFADE